ncbi:MarR family winged helix-turn-helix transcriptional regulator [Georgenia sp. SUBG003]|uniref:MarR family winged helix-turn-helix transcriptional regulator n=1 Tax=Georgenia sp. SUBG003 TaxID=1497974 RepID=UPI000B2E4D5D
MPESSPFSVAGPEARARALASERVLEQLTSLVRRSRGLSAYVAQACGLQAAQVELLGALRRAEECRVASLATHQLVDPSVVSRQIATLEKRGLVARRPDPDDGRASLVSLTDAGREKVAEVRRLHLEAVTESMRDWPVERVSRLAGDLADLGAAAAVVYTNLSGALPATEKDHA